MENLKVALRGKFIHLYAWLAVVPRTFLVALFVAYAGISGVDSFGSAWHTVVGNRLIVVVLLLWGVVNGYVEGWYIWKRGNKNKGETMPWGGLKRG